MLKNGNEADKMSVHSIEGSDSGRGTSEPEAETGHGRGRSPTDRHVLDNCYGTGAL